MLSLVYSYFWTMYYLRVEVVNLDDSQVEEAGLKIET